MSTCCCCCWDAVGVPADSPRITGGPGCSGPPPLCIFLLPTWCAAAADRNHFRRVRQISHVSHTSCCSSILVRPLNAACLLELAALQRTAPVRWPRTTVNSNEKSPDSGNPNPKILLPLPNQTQKFCCHKNIGYLNVKKKRLSSSLAAGHHSFPLSRSRQRRGFRGLLFFAAPHVPRHPVPLPAASSTHSRRDAQTLPRSISSQIAAKNSENRTFLRH